MSAYVISRVWVSSYDECTCSGVDDVVLVEGLEYASVTKQFKL